MIASLLACDDVESARGISLLVFTSSFQMLQQAGWFQPILDTADRVLETNSRQTLVAAARAGVAVAVLPRFVARNYDDLIPVSDNVAEHDIWMVTHPDFSRDPKVRATAEFLREIAKGPAGLI
jgi:DNA-binding transcriptional LysR family regulator